MISNTNTYTPSPTSASLAASNVISEQPSSASKISTFKQAFSVAHNEHRYAIEGCGIGGDIGEALIPVGVFASAVTAIAGVVTANPCIESAGILGCVGSVGLPLVGMACGGMAGEAVSIYKSAIAGSTAACNSNATKYLPIS